MTEQEIHKYLRTKIFGRKLFCFETVDSTNLYAKSLMEQEFEEGILVIAENQTAGRGRLGRTWQSESGKNLTFSILLKPKISPESVGVLSMYASLAVAEAIQEISALAPECKWPNDVLVDEKKLCGILSEAVFHHEKLSGVIIGIGLNVNQTAFLPPLERSATSLALVLGSVFDRVQVLTCILQKLELWYAYLQRGQLQEILSQWQKHTTMFGKELAIDEQGRQMKGIAKSLDIDGGLIVSVNGIEKKILAGDVTILEQH